MSQFATSSPVDRLARAAACSLLLALTACRAPTLGGAPPPEAPERYPFAAVVWELEDKTEDFTTRPSSLDGAPETSLTRSGSAWRPALSMEALSGVLAGELSARLTQSARVASDRLHTHATFEELARGARLFVGGEVREATWTRGGADGGTYHLKLRLFAVIGRRNGEDLAGFWVKEVSEDVPHKGVAREELGAAVRKVMGGAVEELGRAMKKPEVVAALAEGQTEGSDIGK